MTSVRALLLLSLLAGALSAKYHGCYRDSLEDRLFLDGYLRLLLSNTPELCHDHCKNEGYSLAGVENGIDCYCSNDPPPQDKRAPDSECDSTCSGDWSLTCGGFRRLAVFGDSAPPPTTTGPPATYDWDTTTGPPATYDWDTTTGPPATYDWDTTTGPPATYDWDTTTGPPASAPPLADESYLGCHAANALLYPEKTRAPVTVAVCRHACARKEYKFFGMAKGYTCYCGNAILRPKISEFECLTPCRGDSYQICGGSYGEITIYKTYKPDPPPTILPTTTTTTTIPPPTTTTMSTTPPPTTTTTITTWTTTTTTTTPPPTTTTTTPPPTTTETTTTPPPTTTTTTPPPTTTTTTPPSTTTTTTTTPPPTTTRSTTTPPPTPTTVMTTTLPTTTTPTLPPTTIPTTITPVSTKPRPYPLEGNDVYVGTTSDCFAGATDTGNPLEEIKAVIGKSLGCYSDTNRWERMTSLQGKNSPEPCLRQCLHKGFTFAGLQRDYCFCSRTEPNLNYKTSSAECNAECSGNSSKTCGGSLPRKTDVYYIIYKPL